MQLMAFIPAALPRMDSSALSAPHHGRPQISAVISASAVPKDTAGSTSLSWSALGAAALCGAAGRRKAATKRTYPRCAAQLPECDAIAAKEEACCNPCGMLRSRLLPRREVTAGVVAMIAAAAQEGANADDSRQHTYDEACENCGGEGLNECITCKGTGRFRLVSAREQGEFMAVGCPECDGVGKRVCERCQGTGLPSRKLRGFLRDPAFKTVLRGLKCKGLSVETLPEFRLAVKAGVEEAEKRKAKAGA